MYLTPSLFKCHHHFLGQFFVLTLQKIGYCSDCKFVCFHCIPVGKTNYFCCAVLKIQRNLASFAVAVCLIFVDCGGGFLFSLSFGHLFQSDGMDCTFGNQKFCQFVHRFPVGSFCTAGSAALKHHSQFCKSGAVFP